MLGNCDTFCTLPLFGSEFLASYHGLVVSAKTLLLRRIFSPLESKQHVFFCAFFLMGVCRLENDGICRVSQASFFRTRAMAGIYETFRD